MNPVFLIWLKWLTQYDTQQRPHSAQEALDALNAMPADNIVAAHGSSWTWDDNHYQWIARARTRKLEKPEGTKIILHKSKEAIAIAVPLKRLELACSLLVLILLAGMWNGAVLPSFIDAVLSLSLVLASFLLLFVLTGLFMIGAVFASLFSLFTQSWIHIDHNRIAWYSSFLGFNCWSRSEPRTAIRKLVYSPRYYTKNSDGERTMVAPQLKLHIGTREESIGSDLSEAELEWLAQELSDWLGIALEDRSKQRRIKISRRHRQVNQGDGR